MSKGALHGISSTELLAISPPYPSINLCTQKRRPGITKAPRNLSTAPGTPRETVWKPHSGNPLYHNAGKTETALQLATSFGGSSEALVRVDCSEYSERHSLARLIGAPPGYIGHEQGGMLTEALRRRPRCVVLFDEVEKAAPEVHNLLLQILSAGRLTDGMGNTADFRHACLILTSNLGNRPAALQAVDGDLTPGKDPNTAGLLQAVRAALPVELLGRLDATVPFSRLSVEDLEQIVDLKLQDLAQRIPQVQALTATDAARRWLAEHVWSPDYGARELDRVLRSDLEPLLADELWSHTGNQAPQRLRVELATPEGPLALLPVGDQTPPGAVQPGPDVF